jgi:conjugative relaxase-like TrwC/TraI family protein
MLRIVQQNSAAGAVGYYRAGYYAENGESLGVWGGDGAARLGLRGMVEWDAFAGLCENRHQGRKLTPTDGARRRVGYDVSWGVPKSVSVLYEWTLDPDILNAFTSAVDDAMSAFEQEARTRVRRGLDKGTADEERVTANLVWARFIHRTTRPVDGVPDPHLHAHAFVFNATWDATERRWKAVSLAEAKRQGRFFEAVFHSHLAARLRALGFGIQKNGKGRWEIAGIPEGLLKKFSRRTAEIEKLALDRGIVDPVEKDKLGARTREAKGRPRSAEELRQLWSDRMTPEERELLSAVQRNRSPASPQLNRELAIKAVAFALEHCLERRSVVPERTLVAEALRWGVGWVTVTDVFRVVRDLEVRGAVLVRDGQLTTRGVLAEEQRLLEMARAGKGVCLPLAPGDLARGEGLTDEQLRAVEHVLKSQDRIILVRGAAGTGKTRLLKEIVAHLPSVVMLAPSAQASRGVLQDEGFLGAETVARFMVDTALQERARGGVVIVDEAGLLGTRVLVQLLQGAETLGARVVLVGDRRQHASVERGQPLRQLEVEAGLYPASVTKIFRQRGEYRAAVAHLSRGRVYEGFQAIDALGWVTELPFVDERAKAAADAFVTARAKGRSVLVVSPTHAEAEVVTTSIRAKLALPPGRSVSRLESKNLTAAERRTAESYQVGEVVEETRTKKRHRVREVTEAGVVLETGKLLWLAGNFEVYREVAIPLSVGDLVRVTKNGKTLCGKHRLNNGSVYEVKAIGDDGITLSNGWRVSLQFGHLAHGYVSTSHGSQGRTVDTVILYQGVPSMGVASPEQFYVSASRGREQCLVFTDSRSALLRAIAQSDPRTTATELLREQHLRYSSGQCPPRPVTKLSI